MNFELTAELKEKVDKAENLDEVIAILNAEGVEITKEQLEAAVAAENDELSEDDLDNVSGGVVTPVIAGIAFGIAVYKWYKRRR